jgi:hypothetical protein
MPGIRKAGLGPHDGHAPPHPSGISEWCDFSLPGAMGPPGPDGSTEGASAADRHVVLTAVGISFRLGAATYRVLPAGETPGPEDEILVEEQARELLARAEAPVIAQLLRSGTPLLLVRLRPPVPMASVGLPAAPPPAAAASAPRPKVVKEGWIEVEVVDEHGEAREGDHYRLKLPDGRVIEGQVGSNGRIALHGIDPGNAELTITSLDGPAWSN